MSFFSDLNNLAVLGVMLVSGALLVWQSMGSGAGGGRVSPSQATQLINKQNAVIVDVREPGEFALGHLPNAKNLPLGNLAAQLDGIAKDKATPVIAVCQSGMRSNRACSAIKKAGYSQVVNLDGGMSAWQNAGLPVVKGKGA